MTDQQQAMRILVVDDDDCLRGMLTQVLEEDGHDPVTAASGEAALDLFSNEKFPLVLTDIRMGKMSGIDLLTQIKGMNADTEVIIMTSNASIETAVTAVRMGAFDYLMKPFDELEDISAVVNRAIEKIRQNIEKQQAFLTLAQKSSQLEEMNQALQYKALHDGLTGLYNRGYFQEMASREVIRCRRQKGAFSILFFDVDHFKNYNDKNGHQEGDVVLKQVGEFLVSGLRRTDVAARYGGEEFIVLLPDTPKNNAVIAAEKIRHMVEEFPFSGAKNQPLGVVSVSIGVAAFPDDGDDLEEIVKRGDEALYIAKGSGRNRVVMAGQPPG